MNTGWTQRVDSSVYSFQHQGLCFIISICLFEKEMKVGTMGNDNLFITSSTHPKMRFRSWTDNSSSFRRPKSNSQHLPCLPYSLSQLQGIWQPFRYMFARINIHRMRVEKERNKNNKITWKIVIYTLYQFLSFASTFDNINYTSNKKCICHFPPVSAILTHFPW